jgi:hypothetical protein
MKTASSTAFALGTPDRNETPAREIALWRFHLLRAGYLLIAVGMGMQMVPAFLHHRPWELMHGVVNSMLLALVLLSPLGLRYPPENAAASVLGGNVEGYMAYRDGTACVAEPQYGRRHVGYNLRLPDKRDLPVHHAVGLCLA